MKDKINLQDNAKLARQNYHWMPCEIEHTGSAPVSSFFEPNITETAGAASKDAPSLTSSFRGRPLLGSELSLPDGFVAVTLRNGRLDDEPTLRPMERVSKLIHWNWDQPSGTNSSAHQAMDWLKVSEELHKPVSAEQIKKFMEDEK